MKNLSRRVFLILFFALFVGIPVFAATPTTSVTPLKAVILATVNIQNAKIVSQEGNIFNISFNLTNNTPVQSGVKYGILLIDVNSKDTFVVDEKVYSTSLTLPENSNITESIVYEAPKTLSGTYDLIIESKNENSFPFGQVSLGKVTLKASTEGLDILPTSCFLQVVGEKNEPHYNIVQNIDIAKDETLRLTCNATNSTNKTLSVAPIFETRYGTIYGKIAKQIGGDTKVITFNPKEKKDFSIILPVTNVPQIYDVNVKLSNNDIVSNSLNVQYIFSGLIATISNLSSDKDYYKKGDIATLSLIYNTTSSFSRNNRIESNNTLSNFVVKATIVNNKNKECINPINQNLIQSTQTPKVDISVPIIEDCLNPQVSIALFDNKGNVLDQKDFNINSGQIPADNSGNRFFIFLIGILVVAGIALYYFKNLNKKRNETEIK